MVTTSITDTGIVATKVEEAPEALDFLNSLFDQQDQQAAADAEEPIYLPTREEVNLSLHQLSNLLKQRIGLEEERRSFDSPLDAIATRYFLNGTELDKAREIEVEGTTERVKLMLASRVAVHAHSEVSLAGVNTKAYLDNLATDFARTITEFLKIEVGEETPIPTVEGKVGEGEKERGKVPIVRPVPENHSIQGIMAAQMIAPFLQEFAGRIPEITSADQLLNLASLGILTEGSERTKEVTLEVAEGSAIDNFVQLTLLERARTLGNFKGANAQDALDHYHKVLGSLSGYSNYLARELGQLPIVLGEERWREQTRRVVEEISRRYGFIVSFRDLTDRDSYQEYIREVLRGDVSLYEKDETRKADFEQKEREMLARIGELNQEFERLWEALKKDIPQKEYAARVAAKVEEKTGLKVDLPGKVIIEGDKSRLEQLLEESITKAMGTEDPEKPNPLKYKVGDTVTVVKTKGSRAGAYLHGGDTRNVPLGSRHKIRHIQEDKKTFQISAAGGWWVDLEEISPLGPIIYLLEKYKTPREVAAAIITESLQEAKDETAASNPEVKKLKRRIREQEEKLENIRGNWLEYGSRAVLTKGPDTREGEYSTGTKLETFPLGTIVTIRDYAGNHTWRIEGQWNRGVAHESELIPLKRASVERVRKVLPSLEELTREINQAFEQVQERKLKIVEDGVGILHSGGVPDALISLFLKAHLKEGEYDRVRRENLSQQKLRELFPPFPREGYQETFNRLISNLQKEGIYFFSYAPTVQDLGEWTNFKERAVEEIVLQGLVPRKTRIMGNKAKVGDRVLLTKTNLRYQEGTVGECRDLSGERILFIASGSSQGNFIPREDVIVLEPCCKEIDDYSRFERGAKVRIRKDSQYYYQNEGGAGRLEESLITAEREVYKRVNFENGGGNTYRCIDLQLVHPLDFLEGEKRAQYLKQSEEMRARLQMVLPGVISEAEQEVQQRQADYIQKSRFVVGMMSRLGFDEQKIQEVLKEELEERQIQGFQQLGILPKP
jgi:hypothetical protein